MDGVDSPTSGEVLGSPPEGAPEEEVDKSPKEVRLEPSPKPIEGDMWQEDSAMLEWMLRSKEDGKWGMDELQQSLPQPVMYHELLWRDWQDLCGPPLPDEQQFDFAVLSYNILSQDLVEQNPQLYLHCSPLILRWDYRWPNILQELQHWEADILCLQEVQDDHYREQVEPSLHALGYSCHYKRRTGRKTDGCCTCFKAERFTLLAENHVEFFRPAIDVLNRDNVGLVLLLQPRLPEGTQDGRAAPPPLCVANTHLLYNPRRGDIKLAQLALLLAEVEKLSRTPDGSHCPIILCGDLNATPDSLLYQLLHNGVLSYRGLPAWKVSGQERYCTTPNPRLLSSPLWPDFLGINGRCRYITPPAAEVKDRQTYSRQRLLELRYCDCALQRPEDLMVMKGVTDNEPDPGREPAHYHMDNGAPSFRSQPLLLEHSLDLTSVYSHFLPAKGRFEVTTMPLGSGSVVDYIFYSAEPIPVCSLKHGLRFYKDAQLKLLGRLCLLSEEDLWAAQGLPNPFCCSDHLCLLARFSLDLSAGTTQQGRAAAPSPQDSSFL
ncbi:protein angel homolog 1 [Phyllobates terribilis]|uniref:protein angel homolog 1 n=1 Tax=Phyllobates terribilis TaxID=111132 RepID=UPI003CCA7E71